MGGWQSLRAKPNWEGCRASQVCLGTEGCVRLLWGDRQTDRLAARSLSAQESDISGVCCSCPCEPARRWEQTGPSQGSAGIWPCC